jgi:riboflavin kinase / FMN adenylyltransferase
MKCSFGLKDALLTTYPVVFSLGTFDGVHVGHQYLLSQGRQLANELGCLFAVLTFSTFPKQLLSPQEPPLYLTSHEHKRQLLASAGVDILIEIPSTPELMAMEADVFLNTVERMVHVDAWVGGKDLSFGRNREGCCVFLERHAAACGMKTLFFDRLALGGTSISSSRIRSYIRNGDVAQAQLLLGRSYSFLAPCRHVKNEGSASFPASYLVDASSLCLPPQGQYEALARFDTGGGTYPALLSIQCTNLSSTCEVVVLDDGHSSGKFVEVTPTSFSSTSFSTAFQGVR